MTPYVTQYTVDGYFRYARYIYKQHIPKLTQKNCLFCNREQPNLFIQRYSLNIIDMLCNKSFGFFAAYDKDFLRWDESGGFGGGGGGQNLEESGGFGEKNGRNLDFSDELARMQPCSRVKVIEFIKLNGENSGARYFLFQVF